VLGGAIAVRLAAARPAAVARLVLVESLGLAPFAPEPAMGQAIGAFLGDPRPDTHRELWRRCAHDLDALIARLGPAWDALEAYSIERARTPSVQAAMHAAFEALAPVPVPPGDLGRIAAPSSLIWGRHARAIPLAVGREASDAYGWPLHVLDAAGDDAPVECPDAFVAALRACLPGDPS
jgi:pimeloyl-ACP methyl ester carboxylesterase